jgi:hypothetical protein
MHTLDPLTVLTRVVTPTPGHLPLGKFGLTVGIYGDPTPSAARILAEDPQYVTGQLLGQLPQRIESLGVQFEEDPGLEYIIEDEVSQANPRITTVLVSCWGKPRGGC